MAITEEHQKSRDGLRRSIYTGLYGRAQYNWVARDAKSHDFTPVAADGSDNADRYSPRAALPETPVITHKPYVPPTPFNPDASNPFGSVLDAPLR